MPRLRRMDTASSERPRRAPISACGDSCTYRCTSTSRVSGGSRASARSRSSTSSACSSSTSEVERVGRRGSASGSSTTGPSCPRRRAQRRQTLRAIAASQRSAPAGSCSLWAFRHASSRVSWARSSAALRSPEIAAHSRTSRRRSGSRQSSSPITCRSGCTSTSPPCRVPVSATYRRRRPKPNAVLRAAARRGGRAASVRRSSPATRARARRASRLVEPPFSRR